MINQNILVLLVELTAQLITIEIGTTVYLILSYVVVVIDIYHDVMVMLLCSTECAMDVW